MASFAHPGRADETVELFGAGIGHAMNWPPVAGRVFAMLMLHDGPMTTDELQKSLGASSGAISQASRLLVNSGVVRRIKTPGRRKKSYAYREDAWLGCMRHEMDATTELLGLAEAATDSLRNHPPHILGRFEEMRAFYIFIAKAYKQLLQEFEATTRDGSQPTSATGDDGE